MRTLGQDVTVVIPTIPGRGALLKRALKSVTDQQIKPHDFIIQVDHAREGAATTRNRALEKVETEWVAWLDDDDEFLPNHIKVMLRGANKSSADMVFTYPEFIGGRDPLACWWHGGLVAEPINVPFDHDALYSLYRLGNFIPVTYMVKTESVRAVGGFPQPYEFESRKSNDCEDYGLLLRLLDAGYTFHHVCGVRTWKYYYHDANTGGRGADRMHELTEE